MLLRRRFCNTSELGYWLTVLACFLAARGALAVEVDTARENDPRLGPKHVPDPPIEKVARFPPRLKELWLEALGRPETDLKRQAAEALARAHVLGMPGRSESVPRLLEQLQAPKAHPLTRLAIARSLVVLDARQAAPALMKLSQADDFDMARLVEPALARWNYAPMRAVWLDRLAEPQTPQALLTLAIQAAGKCMILDAVPHLRRLVAAARRPADIRLAAARVLAVLQPSGLEELATHLAADGPGKQVCDRLIAAVLLTNHRGPAAEALLVQLAATPDSAVATLAVSRLQELAPARLDPLLSTLIQSADDRLRLLACRALVKQRTPETVALLLPLLDDPNRNIRAFVGESLVELAGATTLSGPIRRGVMQVLQAGGPGGSEQAALVAGAIRHEPAAARLVQLLDDKHAEVRIPAAWALRRLAVPATALPILNWVQRATDAGRKPQSANARMDLPPDVVFAQVEHLIEALGVMRYRPAAPLLKDYLPVPPPSMSPIRGEFPLNPTWADRPRAAAFWSLGHIFAGDPQPDLAALFGKRLVAAGEVPELDRASSALALGWMKVNDAVPALRQIYRNEGMSFPSRRACAWALEQITGKAMAPLKPPAPPSARVEEIWHGGWFLEPVNP